MPDNNMQLHHVSFSRGTKEILRDIHLTLRAGEITCLLGQSGCGKTTLLQLCAGVLTSQSGNITAAYARPGPDVGYMQQHGSLLPWRNAAQNVALGLELLGRTPQEGQIRDVLQQVGLADKAGYFPSQLSGGQQQRVALAQQLVMQPRLLLLDEPLGALDIVLRQELAMLIKEIVKKQEIAALVVTHSPDEAIFLADHLCLLSGRPATIRHRWDMTQDLHVETAFHDVVTAMREECPA